MVSMIIVYWPQVLALLIHRSTIFLPKAFFMRKTMFYLLLMGVVSGMPMLLTAQTITGAVKNSITGEPVPSVSVIVKGSKEGLRTDEKGNFNIHIRSFPATLVFSSISFESQEVKVAGENNNITVQLVPQSFMINEVVIGRSEEHT